MTQLRFPPTLPHLDPKIETIRRAHERAIVELQNQPMASVGIVTATLADGVITPVQHKLGRRPVLVLPSVIRGAPTSAGVLIETSRDATHVYLKASGYGATITLDLAVG